jgi:hypothetical protein
MLTVHQNLINVIHQFRELFCVFLSPLWKTGFSVSFSCIITKYEWPLKYEYILNTHWQNSSMKYLMLIRSSSEILEWYQKGFCVRHVMLLQSKSNIIELPAVKCSYYVTCFQYMACSQFSGFLIIDWFIHFIYFL